jgi:hypothetical protein
VSEFPTQLVQLQINELSGDFEKFRKPGGGNYQGLTGEGEPATAKSFDSQIRASPDELIELTKS